MPEMQQATQRSMMAPAHPLEAVDHPLGAAHPVEGHPQAALQEGPLVGPLADCQGVLAGSDCWGSIPEG